MNKNIRIMAVSLAAPAVAAVIGGGAYLGFGTHAVLGTPVANHDQVVAVHQEQAAAAAKAQAEADAKDQADLIAREESATMQDMQAFLDDPANGWASDHIVVSKVILVVTTGNAFDGIATMSANGGPQHDIAVHLVDDGHSSMWSTAPGAMLPLFQ